MLVSGAGTNLQALIDACRDEAYGAQVVAVGADRPGITALDRAERAGIPSFILRLSDYPSREEWDAALARTCAGYQPDLVVLAGFMGADKAVHLLDDGLAGSDALSTSYAIAKVLEQTGFDLVISGSESTDARMGVMAAMLAERLGVPQVSLASKVEIDGTAIRIRRVSEDGYFEVESTLPAVISVVEKINEPRYPSFKGIMASRPVKVAFRRT